MNAFTVRVARELAALADKKETPDPKQWCNYVAALTRIFELRPPATRIEKALFEVVKLAKKNGGATKCKIPDVVLCLTQLSVVLKAENLA